MTQNASSMLDESLSALIDGEHNDIDLQRVMRGMHTEDKQNEERRLESRKALRKTWSRYHLVGAVMRKDIGVDFQMDLSSSVMAAIAEEEQPSKRAGGVTAWLSGIGKTAVAASVTLGVVFAAQQFAINGDSDSVMQADLAASAEGAASDRAPSGAVVPQGFELPPLSARTVSASAVPPQHPVSRSAAGSAGQGAIIISREEFKEQVDRLMFKHAEQVSSTSALGVIPFVRVSDAHAFKADEFAESKGANTTALENEVEKEAQ